MDERSQVMLTTLLWAVVGAIVGGLYLTERGRRLRDQIDPALDGFINEIERVRGTVDRAKVAAEEGRRAFDDAMAAARAQDATESSRSELSVASSS